MKLIALCSVFLVFAIAEKHGAPGQSVTPQELEEKLKFYRSIVRLEAQFKQIKTVRDLRVKLPSEGKLTLIRPHQVIWEVTQPAPVKVTLDRSEVTIRSRSEDGKEEVTTFKASQNPSENFSRMMKSMVAWLNLDARYLSQEYFVSRESDDSFHFVPKNQANSPFRNLQMKVSQEGYLKTLTLVEKSNDQIEMNFEKPKLFKQ